MSLFLTAPFTEEELNELNFDHHMNARTDGKDMLEGTRELLDTFYQPFNEHLAQMLGDKNYLWRSS